MRMSPRFGPIIAACLIAAIAGEKQTNLPESIALSRLSNVDVIGQLGVPLGQITEVEATIVAGRSIRKKFVGLYLLRIDAVNGRRLPNPVLTRFNTSTADADNINIAPNEESLLELLKRTRPGFSTAGSPKRVAMEEGYVGSRVKLWVVSEATFSSAKPPFPEWYLEPTGGGWRPYHVSEQVYVLRQQL